MRVLWAAKAWGDYLHWQKADANTAARINDLVKECCRDPFRGLGRPEPLKGDLKGWWSRRINTGDRLVYRVTGQGTEQTLEIAQCRFHY